MSTKCRALFVVPLIIIAISAALAAVGCLLDYALGIPARFQMPWAVRCCGLVVLGLGLAVMGWIVKYRKPGDILVSTYVTIHKSVNKTSAEQPAGRTEPLVLQGPQQYVRHPMYFAVVVLVIGWWLMLDHTFILWMAFFFFLWFNLVVIRFEEKELKALYGEQYETYAKTVPRFFPSLKCRWH